MGPICGNRTGRTGMFEKEMIIISKQVSNILKYNKILKLKAMRNHAIIIERKTKVMYVGLHFQGVSAVQL